MQFAGAQQHTDLGVIRHAELAELAESIDITQLQSYIKPKLGSVVVDASRQCWMA